MKIDYRTWIWILWVILIGIILGLILNYGTYKLVKSMSESPLYAGKATIIEYFQDSMRQHEATAVILSILLVSNGGGLFFLYRKRNAEKLNDRN